MKTWQEIYQEKLMTPEQAAQLVESGDNVFTSTREAVETLKVVLRRKDLHDIHVDLCNVNHPDIYFDEDGNYRSGFHISTGFMEPTLAAQYDEGALDFTPAHYSSRYKQVQKHRHCRVGMVCVTPPNKDGYVSFGTSADGAGKIIGECEVRIAEINPQMPFTFGPNLMHIREFTAIVETEGWPMSATEVDTSSNEVYTKVGGYLSELIEDEATLEIGIGRLNSAALWNLDGVKDLGIHTEIFGDVMHHLIEKGIVTNRCKSINKDKSICCMVIGSKALYEYADHNPNLQVCDPNYALNPAIIAQNHKMTAINNAINVDLLGQVNSESLRGRQYSGMGGIDDFSRGASLCPNGKSIIVLESATKGAKYSKIVPTFDPATPISVPRADVEYIVTEYGVAKVAGCTVRERARELIKVAHPNFREQLTEQAKQLGIL